MVARIVGAILLTFAALARPVAAPDAGVSLRMFDGLPLVPVSVNGSTARWFVIDTGSTTTTLSERFARELGIAAAAPARIETTTGNVTAAVGFVESVRVGTVELGRGEIVAQRLEPIGMPKDVDGVLGFDRLARVNFLVDYRSRTLRLDPGGTLKPTLSGERTPFVTSMGRPIIDTLVQVRNAPGRARRLVVDTGATTAVLLDRLPDAAAARTLVTGAGPAPARAAEVFVTINGAALPLTAAVIVEPRAHAVREDQGLLPASVFAWMYFDVVKNEIVWQRS